MTCGEIRLLVHEAHDEPGLPVPDAVRDHLANCAACREFSDDLTALSRALRAMPRAPLPEDTLDAVWRRTVGARARGTAIVPEFWRLAAAAVVVMALSATTLYFVFAPRVPAGTPSAVELARAEAQADLVFGYTARALAATRSAAADRVLASKVSPAVRGVSASPAPRRSR